jgi:fluoroquinolone resistance protein
MPSPDEEKQEYISEALSDLNWAGCDIQNKTFDDCTFQSCDFSEATLSKCKFIDCHFIECNISLINIRHSKFSDVFFDACKLVGVDWTKAQWSNLAVFSPIKFQKCILNDSSFHGLDLKEMHMEECKAHDVDFREANFSDANFSYTDFSFSLFNKTNLSGANFAEATHFSIDIYSNTIKGAKFCRDEAVNLLDCLGIELID